MTWLPQWARCGAIRPPSVSSFSTQVLAMDSSRPQDKFTGRNKQGSGSMHCLHKATSARPKHLQSSHFPVSPLPCSTPGLAKVTDGSLLFWLLETTHKKETFKYLYWFMYPVTPLASFPSEREPWLLQITQFFKVGAEVEIRLVNLI